MRAYRLTVALFGLAFVAIGFALLLVTALRGGGAGYLFGALFVALGAGRLYLLRQR